MAHSTRVKFLVYSDNSDHARTALRFACLKAKAGNNPVEVLYVVEPMDYRGIAAIAETMRRERWADAEQKLKDLAESIEEFAGVIPSLLIREGLPSQEILAALEQDNSINLLILGIGPDSSSTTKTLLNSLIGELGGKLQIPMTIVPSSLTDQQILELC